MSNELKSLISISPVVTRGGAGLASGERSDSSGFDVVGIARRARGADVRRRLQQRVAVLLCVPLPPGGPVFDRQLKISAWGPDRNRT